MNNSHNYKNSISIEDLHKTALIDNNYCYSISFAILFEKRRDCQNFLKIVRDNCFSLASRKSNLFRIEIANCDQLTALNQANKFLKLAKENEFNQLTNFIYFN